MSESDILGPVDNLSDIENLVIRLKGLCLKNTVLSTERKYSYYLWQYHHVKVNAWSIMNGVHDKYKPDTFLSIHLGLN